MADAEIRTSLYVANRKALIEYATRILGSRETAEDIVQEAFLRFAPANASFGSAKQTVGYLYRIVRNLAFDALKRRRVEAREQGGDPPFWSIPGEERSPEQILLLSDELRQVSLALSELPVDVRIALEMHRFGDYTLDEIAERLDISVATAHRHVRTAMMRIAERLTVDT